jgi:hypothetical protein
MIGLSCSFSSCSVGAPRSSSISPPGSERCQDWCFGLPFRRTVDALHLDGARTFVVNALDRRLEGTPDLPDLLELRRRELDRVRLSRGGARRWDQLVEVFGLEAEFDRLVGGADVGHLTPSPRHRARWCRASRRKRLRRETSALRVWIDLPPRRVGSRCPAPSADRSVARLCQRQCSLL